MPGAGGVAAGDGLREGSTGKGAGLRLGSAYLTPSPGMRLGQGKSDIRPRAGLGWACLH